MDKSRWWFCFLIMKVFPLCDFAETFRCIVGDVGAMEFHKIKAVYTWQPFSKWKCRRVSDVAMVGRFFWFWGKVEWSVCYVHKNANLLSYLREQPRFFGVPSGILQGFFWPSGLPSEPSGFLQGYFGVTSGLTHVRVIYLSLNSDFLRMISPISYLARWNQYLLRDEFLLSLTENKDCR